jgi:hypothetical protein
VLQELAEPLILKKVLQGVSPAIAKPLSARKMKVTDDKLELFEGHGLVHPVYTPHGGY